MPVERLKVSRGARQLHRIGSGVQQNAVRRNQPHRQPAVATRIVVVSAIDLRRLLHLLGRGENVLDTALQIEGLLRYIVVLAIDDLFEASDRILNLDVRSGDAGEDLRDMERLREEIAVPCGPARP